MRSDENKLEGRNPVIEAFRAGRVIDKVYVVSGSHDGPLRTIVREASKANVPVEYIGKDRLDKMSSSGMHQGVIALCSVCEYSTIDDILKAAEDRGEDPFIFILDGIEDPHNLGAIIRTANLCGAHGVIIPKNRAASLTAAAARAAAGALNFTPIAKVTNISRTIDELKQKGLWFVCGDMDGEVMYDLDLTGPIGLVIGSEGSGVSRNVAEHCDMKASIPMKGNIDSLNASVAAAVLAYEIVRRRFRP